ncbi:hypothetical protein VOLCADRAFT_106296 [Volvox carteri f. nagariensis]|uniref:Glucose-6-phosphate 1-epimerase n=1 Tax=Volvox carteri f. nagariensis TaxID=3068 RepID=D8U6F1_VOLCA|nr:uncharacterized protein VOLCADRAFT_106296 [Volvox carteri f. nagariensis]EFJ44634.1 hypothetical protein VOLCADRAFT_106296 [Volvox carteri f. nagariensis]|eukprot:XP_002954210.1 hypothetical protein VOLCADRAFT_106296 [Volvox carteri f. nagariensis]
MEKLEIITLKTQGGQTAQVSAYGGQLLTWRNEENQDYLFLSKNAVFDGHRPIRGGVPICYPEFTKVGPGWLTPDGRGFVRNKFWLVWDKSDTFATLELSHGDRMNNEGYPFYFEIFNHIELRDDHLEQHLSVINKGLTYNPFTAALHTYFAVSDISNVKVEGLQGLTYEDSTDSLTKKREEAAEVVFPGEVDRIYIKTPDVMKGNPWKELQRWAEVQHRIHHKPFPSLHSPLPTLTFLRRFKFDYHQIHDSGAPGGGRTYEVCKQGFPDAVLWNPGAKRGASISDLGDPEWRRMVCLGPGHMHWEKRSTAAKLPNFRFGSGKEQIRDLEALCSCVGHRRLLTVRHGNKHMLMVNWFRCASDYDELRGELESHKRAGKLRAIRAYDEEAPMVTGDWREFRAKLIMQSGARRSEDNRRLLEIQNPSLAAEGLWAHATSRPETGGLVIASLQGPTILNDDRLWQVVVFLTSHGADGSVGLILNRPTGMVLGRKPGGLPLELGGPVPVQRVFQDNRVYCGGFTAQQLVAVIHIMHGHRLNHCVQEGRLPSTDFKFFAGALTWAPGQLEEEVAKGAWYPAACSRSLVLKPALQLPVPLWREVLQLMGGQYLGVAREGYEGDEVGKSSTFCAPS